MTVMRILARRQLKISLIYLAQPASKEIAFIAVNKAMKQINIFGALLCASAVMSPLLGLRGDLFHLVYGSLYLFFTLTYASLVISNQIPVPGLRIIEYIAGRWAVSTLMYIMVIGSFVYAGYGLQNWLQASVTHIN